MKNKILIPIIITATAAFTIFVGVTLSNVAKTNNAQSDVAGQKEKLCCADLSSQRVAVSDNSIYQLDSKWKDVYNKTVSLKSLMGKKEIVAMVYTNCSYACPLILNDMKKIELQVKRNDVNYLLVSIDPQRDTPVALKKFADRNNLDPNKWHLLTGDENGISELAAVLEFKYRQDPDGNFSHSNIITVLNENGEIAYQHFGLNQDIKDVLNEIKTMENK